MREQEPIALRPNQVMLYQLRASVVGIAHQVTHGVEGETLAQHRGRPQPQAIPGSQRIESGQHDALDCCGDVTTAVGRPD